MIFDTNILIYISQNILKVKKLISPDTPANISIISYIEALGYPFAIIEDEQYMQLICAQFDVVYLSDAIIKATIELRKQYKIKLPDAIIYATALVENQPLLTNNIDDFKKLDGRVQLIDPFTL